MANEKLYVGNISYGTNKEDLQDLFGQHGDVVDAVIITDRMTGRSRGFGFVTMGTEKEAEAALSLSGFELDGRELQVNVAQERREGGGGGRRGGGGRGGFGGGGGGNRSRGRWDD